MKCRVAIWTGIGFFTAWAWVLYTFVASPEEIIFAMREPLVLALAYASCPIIFAARSFPLHFWWVPLINAASYASIGASAETFIRLFRVRSKSHGLVV